MSRWLKPWIGSGLIERMSTVAPAASSASRGLVNSTCSTPSVARIATFLPSSLPGIISSLGQCLPGTSPGQPSPKPRGWSTRCARDRAPARSRSARRSCAACRRAARRRPARRPRASGDPPFSSMLPVLSPTRSISASSSALSTHVARQRRKLRALGLDRLRIGPRLLDQRRDDAGDGGLRERPLAGELQERQVVALGDRAHEIEPLAARLDPAGGPEQAMVGLDQHRLVEERVVEEPAVVDDAGQHLHVVLRCGRQRETRRPGLERVQDQHRPVDQRAEALEAGDHVEREAVRGARSDADRVGEPLVAQAGERAPDLLGRVADAIGVVQQQQVEAIDAAALEARLGRAAQVVAVAAGAAQARDR